jgi:transcriptional regulator with PAS, ATPase and Fis domain
MPVISKNLAETEDKPHEEEIIFDEFVGESKGLLKVLKIIEKVSKTSSSVLVTGESGTGKELVARSIHFSSSRKNNPLIIINCGAIPGELLESELFGHEKGSFTGAHKVRIGRLEVADGGTVFLDEIGDMTPELQVKLLRAVQERKFERVGGTKSIEVDIRIVSATNKDLLKAIREGQFREDLYYRLNVIPIDVPSLKKRKTDIKLLIEHFLIQLSERISQKKKNINKEALAKLIDYSWPGNIRELENLMERLSVLVDGDTINIKDLPNYITASDATIDEMPKIDMDLGFNESVEKFQKSLIVNALVRTNWVKAKAATLLKMNRTTLVEKIKKLKIEQNSDRKNNKPSVEDLFG